MDLKYLTPMYSLFIYNLSQKFRLKKITSFGKNRKGWDPPPDGGLPISLSPSLFEWRVGHMA